MKAYNQNFSQQVGATVVDIDSVNPGNAVRIGSFNLLNTTGAFAYLQIFKNPASTVTLGTTVPDHVIGLPANGGAIMSYGEAGWLVGGTGFSVAGTTQRSNAAAALVECGIVFGYRVP
jgi:hypothetical protein